MSLSTIQIKEADDFASNMMQMLQHSISIDIDRFRISATLCSLSLEHWTGGRVLLSNELITSSIALLRCQYEALVRSVWIHNTASNDVILKLCEDLDLNSEQNAKNIPGVADMLSSITKGADRNISGPLNEFKKYSWNALNSYTHSGLHAINRSRNGFPDEILENIFRQSNGLALIAGMQYALLTNVPNLQKDLIRLSYKYPRCMPNVHPDRGRDN